MGSPWAGVTVTTQSTAAERCSVGSDSRPALALLLVISFSQTTEWLGLKGRPGAGHHDDDDNEPHARDVA